MMDNTKEINQPIGDDKPVREWLLMQAQLQMDYANVEHAVVLLELVEAVFGESLTSGLMLCKSWMRLQNREKLELNAKHLLTNPQLNSNQMAVIYFCLSRVRWQCKDHSGARKAHALYTSLLNEVKTTS